MNAENNEQIKGAAGGLCLGGRPRSPQGQNDRQV